MEWQSDTTSRLLQDIQGGLSYGRRDAAYALGELEESSESVVIALLVAKESDTNDDVRKAAASTLEAPVHQRYIQTYPEVIQKAKTIVLAIQAQRVKEIQQEMVQAGNQNRLRGWGIWAIIVGGIALVLPLFGYELLLFRSIPTGGSPLCGIGLIVVGIIVFIMSQKS